MLILAAAAVACGSSSTSPPAGGGGPAGALDCAWASGTNCWKSAIAAAQSCLPPNDRNAVPGSLSPDLTTCTYASGQTIAFARPLIQQGHRLPPFDLTKGGKPCLKFDELSNGDAITTAAGTLTITLDANQTRLTVACPDGSAFSGSQASLASCDNLRPGLGQGAGGVVNDAGIFSGSFGVTLEGTEGGSTEVFSCATP